MAKKDKGVLTGKPVTYQIPCPAGGVQMETFIPWTLVKRGIRREIITPLDAPQAFTVPTAPPHMSEHGVLSLCGYQLQMA